jgi:enamine deaminase RidA (YjgF/YER057c/UK114 family)
MERHFTNAGHTWQDTDGFVQACEVRDGRRVLYCSGQLSVAADGKPLHPGDMVAQIHAAMDNVEALLKSAGYTLADVVRLNVYTTDIDQCLHNWGIISSRLKTGSCLPACTLLGITRLAWPETMVEIEATAVSE